MLGLRCAPCSPTACPSAAVLPSCSPAALAAPLSPRMPAPPQGSCTAQSPLVSWLTQCSITFQGVKRCLTSCLISWTATALRGDYFVFNLLSSNHPSLRSGKGQNTDWKQSVSKQNNSNVAAKDVNEKVPNQFLTKWFQEVLPHLPAVIWPVVFPGHLSFCIYYLLWQLLQRTTSWWNIAFTAYPVCPWP